MLNEILKADITREIEGVVKADDDNRIGQEIREYVITAEITKLLRTLFEGYSEAIDRQTQKSRDIYPYNGAWISGYFGSGKSHLLKILSYLLSVDADSDLRKVFLEKIDDAFLRSAVEKAFRTPSQSILFNIDQKVETDTNETAHPILRVFEKVFNHAVGYCDDDPVIADFERDLDTRGEYEAFQEVFKTVNGDAWEDRRVGVFTMDRPAFTGAWAAFKSVSEEEADRLLDRYESSRSISTETFAKRVKDWLDRQGATPSATTPSGAALSRINFFVDEVGQFIAGDRAKMLNLQTVAETLATVCENRVWVFVTSQEDIDAVIGDATQEQRADFSRITARFHFRLPLTSSNVEEVIQKRLLDKTPDGARQLAQFYESESDHLRTVFQFGKGVKELRFKSADDFVLSYPFLKYQFYYLQSALKGLSSHNAFTGRHVSRGERSMLEVFQDVGKQMAQVPLIRFATFDQMFDGIRQTLQSAVLQQVRTAEDNLDNPMAVRIIKALLMLKYVEDFTATTDTITTLMVDSLEQDRSTLRHQVQEALDTLEFQSYIQRRGGDEYEYLTDREKDVEVGIKNVQPEYSEIRRLLGEVIVGGILKSNKLIYEANNQPYQFTVFVDEEQYRASPSALTLRIITHLHPNAEDTQTLLNQSMGKKELLVILNVSKHADSDLRLFHQTKTYLSHNAGGEDPQQNRILAAKRDQNAQRDQNLRQHLIPQMVESATLYVADRALDIGIKDPRQRLTAAFQELVSVSFPNLRLLSGMYTEDGIRRIIFPPEGESVFSGDAVGMGEDEADLQAFLQRQEKDAHNTSLARVKEVYSRGQYGWYEWAILGVVVKLFVREAVELTEGTRVLDKNEVLQRLLSSHGHEGIKIRLAQPLDTALIGTLSEFYQDFFHKPVHAQGGKELLVAIKKELIELRSDVRDLLALEKDYPFLSRLGPVLQRYDELSNLDIRSLADTIRDDGESLLMEKVENVDKTIAFMNGPPRGAYDKIRLYLQSSKENFIALEHGDTYARLGAYLENGEPWARNATKDALDLYSAVANEIASEMETVKESARSAVSQAEETLKGIDAFTVLSNQHQEEVLRPITYDLSNRITNTSSIDALRHIADVQAPRALQRARERVQQLANPEEKVEYARPAEKQIAFSKTELITPEDVDAYADELRTQWRKLVESGKRIGL